MTIRIEQQNSRIIFKHDGQEFKSVTMNKWSSILAHRAAPTQVKAPAILTELRVLYEQFQEPFNLQSLQILPTQQVVEEVEPLPTEIPSLPEILAPLVEWRRKDMEILITFAASDKSVENPAWLGLVAASSTGKTFLEEMLDHPSISVFVDEVTLNGMAAGRPNTDAAETDSLFQRAHNHNLVMNDMSSMLTLDEKQVYKFMGAITEAYGQRYRKFSPGGMLDIETGFSLIIGMTHHLYKKQRKMMSILGSRLLFHKMKRPEDMRLSEDTRAFDKDTMRLQICKLVQDTLQSEYQPAISTTVDDYLYSFARRIIRLRCVRWATNIHELEGESRLYQQLKLLCKTRAKIYHREVLKEDVDFFMPLAVNTIPYTNNLKHINDNNNKWTKSILQNAIKFDMVEVVNEIVVEDTRFGKSSRKEPVYCFKQEYDDLINMIDFESCDEGDD